MKITNEVKWRKIYRESTVEGIKPRIKSNLEYKEEDKRIQKNGDSVRSLWDNFKCTNTHIIGVLEGEEKEQEIENLF